METQLRVLTILSENLKNPQPQVVGIEQIAEKLQMSLAETRQLLFRMDEAGIIESAIDGRLSLITPAGLHRLNPLDKTLSK